MNNWLDKYDEGIIPSAQEGTSIFDEGARVAREEYLRQQYQDYLRGEAQKGREAVQRGMHKGAKKILPWMAVPFAGAAASALTVIPLITAPSATIAGMVGGTAGMYLTDRAVKRYSDDKYGTWGEMMAGATGIPSILGEFTNPGALIGGMMGSAVPGVIRKIPGQYSNLVTAAQKGQLYKINPFARKADPTKVYTTMTENRARYILDKNAPITRYSTPGKRDVYHPVFDDKGNITHYVVQSDMERFLQTGGANTPIGVYFMNKMRTIPSTIGEQLRRPKYKNTMYGLPDKTSYGYSYRRTLNEVIEEAIKQRGAYSSISPDVKFRFGAIPNYGKPKGAQSTRRVTRHRMPAPAKFEPNPIIMEGDPTKISFVGAPSKAERLQYIPRDIGNFPIGKTAIPEESIIGNELSYGPGFRMMRQDPVWGLSPLREGEMDLLRTTSVLPERESRIINAILGFDKALNKVKSFKLSSVNVNMPSAPRELIDRIAGTYRGYVTPIQQKVLAGDRWSAEDDLVFRKLSSLRKLTSELEGYSPNKRAELFKLIESSPLSNEELQHFINQYRSGVGTFTSKVSLAQDIAQQRSPVKGIKDVQVFAGVSNQPNQTLIDLSKRSDVFKQYFEKQYQKRIDKILEANAVPMLPPGSGSPESAIGSMFRNSTANVHSELEQAIARIKTSPGGKTFIGSGSLSGESYPLTVYKGSSIFGNDPGYGIFRGEYMPINTYDDFRRLGVNPEYIATYLNNYLRRVNVGGKRFPAARVHYDPNLAPNVEVPTFYLKKYKGGGIIPSAQGGKSVIFAESPTLEIASAQDGLSAKLAPIKQKVREKLYRTIPPSDYPIRQLPSVVKNLITGKERMNSLDEINQLLEEREQLSPIIKQYEKDFSRAWDSSYGEGRHEAISKVTDKYGRELDELSRIEMRLDEISGGYDVVDEDLWRKYLEMPQLQGSVRPSRYKPAKAKDPSAEYFTIPDVVEDGTRNWKADVFKFASEHEKGKGEFPTYGVPGPPGLARIKVDKGKDKKGEYYSIYDIYDFNIPGERLIGKPFEIYDRIYLDKDKKGNYTPRYQRGGITSKFLEPNSPKLPIGHRPPLSALSSERAMSIGGEGGEPAYLIPSFKYGRPLLNPIQEFQNTGEHLGGPFKTWQEADKWEREIRHPYVEKGQPIPTPLRRWGKEFKEGGAVSKIANITKYDEHIWKAAKETGADPYVLKAIMMQESSFRPRKNKLGYEGFSQTNQETIDTVNRNMGTSYTIEDQYDPYMAAKFIAHNLELMKKKGWATSLDEQLIGYNWGPGYVKRYRKTKELPKETANYVAKINEMISEWKPKIETSGSPAPYPAVRDATNVSRTLPIYDIPDDAGIVQDNAGYLNPSNYGSPVRIGSNDITMRGVPFPVLGVSDEGEVRIMMPGEDHRFRGSSLTEFPLAQSGVTIPSSTNNLSNFTKPKGWLDRYDESEPTLIDHQIPEVKVVADRLYPYKGCVEGTACDLSSHLKVGNEEFRKMNNFYGNAWNVLDNMYGNEINITNDYSGLNVGDVVNMSRKKFKSDIEKGIPESNQHIGRVSKIENGIPYIKHYISSDKKYYEEPINNISAFAKYDVTRAKRPDTLRDIDFNSSNLRFDENYEPNEIEQDILKVNKPELQRILRLPSENYDKLERIAYGIMGTESSFGRSKRSVYRMVLPDFVQKSIKVTHDMLRGKDVYDENINNLSQGYSSTKESSLHGVSDNTGELNYEEINKRVRDKDFTGLERTNNYLYQALQNMGLNADNLESGSNSFKAVMATLAWLNKRFPNITEEELLKKYTGKKDISSYKEVYDSYLKNIDNNPNNNMDYSWFDEALGKISHVANQLNNSGKKLNSMIVSKLRDSVPVPENASALFSDLLGAKEPITEKTLRKNTLDKLTNIVRSNIKKGKFTLEYNDYGTSSDKNSDVGAGKSPSISKMMNDEAYILKTLLGQATIKELGNNEYEIVDTYDFNDKGKSFGFIDDLKKRGYSPYAIVRSLGRNYGSQPNQGSQVRIKIKL